MSKYHINDEVLSKYIRKTEIQMLNTLPKEEDLSHKFSKQFEKKMKKLIRQEKRTPLMRSFVGYGKRAAAILLVIISITLLTTMSVEAYRVRFFQIITEIFEEYTSIRFESEEGVSDRSLIEVNPEYIPEGFSILEKDLDDYGNRIIYRNTNDEEIIYDQMLISNGQIIFDTEGVEVETMELGDQKITYFTNKGVSQIYWNDDLYMYTFHSTIDMEELIEMAKSIL